jgi:hypothetical protein
MADALTNRISCSWVADSAIAGAATIFTGAADCAAAGKAEQPVSVFELSGQVVWFHVTFTISAPVRIAPVKFV